MRVSLMAFALAALVSGARAENHDLTTAILVQPIHDAQVVHADDGKDHVDYELLVVNAFAAPFTLSSVIVLDPSEKELGRIEGDALAAATQTLLAQTPGASIPASAAASVDVDLALPAGTAPDRVTHRIVYAIKPDAPLASIVGTFSISGPEVQVNRAPAITIRPPLTGKGWWAANGCCAPNAHRDTRIAIDGSRIETPETFAIDWTQLKDGKTFEGDGARNEEHYAFGADVLAVADGTVVSVRDGMPEETPSKPPVAVHAPGDYGGNYVILQLAANVYAAYAHMQPGSISVKPGERVRGGDRIGKLGNTGNSTAPHLHFSLLDRPDFLAGRSLPFVFDNFVYGGTVVGGDPNKLEITGTPRAVKSAYPLYPGIQDFR
jgi:peptidase M23-like protein